MKHVKGVMAIDWKDRTTGRTEKIPTYNDLTMSESVKMIADWLRTYNQKYDIRYVIMYHAAKKNAPVLEQGLIAGSSRRKNFGMSENGYVYLATTPTMAKMFGDMAHNGNFTIYEVIVPVGKLLSDKGRLQYSKPENISGSSLAHSLVCAGSARVKGSIEKWQIKLHEEKPSLLANLAQKNQEVKERSASRKTRGKTSEERS